MATDSIQAPPAVSFHPPRPGRRDERPRGGFEFAHWLADDALANDDLHAGERFPVPLMSAEGILILAQAQEEEFALHGAPTPQIAYEHAAEVAPPEQDQLSFEFITDVHGAVVDGEV